eukprot:GHVQ01025378.1.p1 GENE.GHVQ01025378.1~~GHVQ01025378.1.p1  ORF type:complete len:523 (+),score=77.77 GHVQ01025378.1:167-1735(+)
MSKRPADEQLVKDRDPAEDAGPAGDLQVAAPEVLAKRSILRVSRGPRRTDDSLAEEEKVPVDSSAIVPQVSEEKSGNPTVVATDGQQDETGGPQKSDVTQGRQLGEAVNITDNVTEEMQKPEAPNQLLKENPTGSETAGESAVETAEKLESTKPSSQGSTSESDSNPAVVPTEPDAKTETHTSTKTDSEADAEPVLNGKPDDTGRYPESKGDEAGNGKDKDSSSCLPPASTLTNTVKYDNPFVRHGNASSGSGLFSSDSSSTVGKEGTAAGSESHTTSTSTALNGSSSALTSKGGLFSGGLFGGLSTLGGGASKSSLFDGAPLGCGLFGTYTSGSSSVATHGASADDGEDAEQPPEEKPEPLETVTNENEENIFQEGAARFSKMVNKDQGAGKVSSEWISSINGKVEVTKPKENCEGRARITFHQSGSGRLLLNTDIFPDACYKEFKGKSVIFNGRQLDDASQLIPYRLTFGTTEIRRSFLGAIRTAQGTTPTDATDSEQPASTESSSTNESSGDSSDVNSK